MPGCFKHKVYNKYTITHASDVYMHVSVHVRTASGGDRQVEPGDLKKVPQPSQHAWAPDRCSKCWEADLADRMGW